MARGRTIGEVDNILDSLDMNGSEKIPVSSGETEPQVVTIGELKEYINDDVSLSTADIIDAINRVNRLTT